MVPPCSLNSAKVRTLPAMDTQRTVGPSATSQPSLNSSLPCQGTRGA